MLKIDNLHTAVDGTAGFNVTSIAIEVDTEWRRWDGMKYTDSTSGSFTLSRTEIEYIPMYSPDNGLTWKHMVEGLQAGAEAVAAANIFHYTEHATKKAKSFLARAGMDVRLEGRIGA